MSDKVRHYKNQFEENICAHFVSDRELRWLPCFICHSIFTQWVKMLALMTACFLLFACGGGSSAGEGVSGVGNTPATPLQQSSALSLLAASSSRAPVVMSASTHSMPVGILMASHSSTSSLISHSSSLGSDYAAVSSVQATTLIPLVNNDPPQNEWPEAWQYYAQTLGQPLVNSTCIKCHTQNAMAGHTRLVFDKTSTYINAERLSQFVLKQRTPDELLRKITGFDSHGGGAIISQNQPLYQNVQAFIELVTPHVKNEKKAVWGKAHYELRVKTLRRAALILKGSLPNKDQKERAARSDEELKKVVHELMQGYGFEQFLMRATNDQLLTDGFFNGRFFELSNGFASYYPVGSNKRYFAYDSGDIWPFELWNNEVYHSMVRAPLALMAYTVMNDLPYTNILTADYTLGNKSTAEYMRQNVNFERGDKFDVKPFKNNGQILLQPGHSQYLDPTKGLRIDQHGDWVDYPHAGILNEPAFLARYPSSETNRNRLRAKMVYKLFLGVDIENIAARATPVDALIDTENPTLNNPACAVCHQSLDPVAGAFQNFGVDGWYRSEWLGLDALPWSYKHQANTPYKEGDLWFADMRKPGFENTLITDSGHSLAQLGQLVIKDNRFAEGAVKFWWPAVMSDALLAVPSAMGAIDSDDNYWYLYEAQQHYIQNLAQQFRQGFDGGKPYQLKDLLAAMVLGPWFRVQSAATESGDVLLDNPSVAGVRLLTPEELETKVKAITGFAWGERDDAWNVNGKWSFLNDQYRVYYGGIDSLGVTERAKVHNTLMANVAETQALNLACATVLLDANRAPESQRLLRNQMRYVSPFSYDWQRIDLPTPQKIAVDLTVPEGAQRVRVSFLNAERIGPIVFDGIKITAADGTLLFDGKKQAAQLTLSQQGDLMTGVNAGGTLILEKGYWDAQFDALGYSRIHVQFEALTPFDWVEPAELNVEVLQISAEKQAVTAGERVIRQQLVDLFAITLGVDYDLYSTEVTQVFDSFMAVWQSLEMTATPMTLAQHANNYCNLSSANIPEINTLNTSDPERLLATWSHMMVYFFTDFYFLYE